MEYHLSWTPHITPVCFKAKQILGLLYRGFYNYAEVDTLHAPLFVTRKATFGICMLSMGPSHSERKNTNAQELACIEIGHQTMGLRLSGLTL